MKNYIYLIELMLGGLLTSCGTADLLTYDQLVPAEISLPTSIRQIGVVNNMPYRDAASKNDLLLGVVGAEGAETAEQVAGALADSKYFDQVVICDSALQARDADINVDPKLSMENVTALTRNLGVDMLVSVERLWVETAKKEVLYPGWDVPFPVVQSTVTPVVRLYVPGRAQPIHTISLTDSIFWDMGTPISEDIVLEEATKLAASKISEHIAPSWKQAERIYFSGGTVEMRDAAVYLREGSWQEAQDTWKELYNRIRKGKTKAKTAYNIALSYEMLGNIEEANQWIQQALKYVTPHTQEETIIKFYSEELARRIQEVVNLKVQMSRFNDNF